MCLYHRIKLCFPMVFFFSFSSSFIFPQFFWAYFFPLVCFQKQRFVLVSKLLILIHKNTMVIKATTKIMIKVTVTPTNADVSTHREELTESTLPSKLITTSSFSWFSEVTSSTSKGGLTSWMSLGASTWNNEKICIYTL